MNGATCAVEVRRGDTWHPRREPCGKNAKGTLIDGTPACGTHLNVEKRLTKGQRKRAEFEARKEAVSAALGLEVWGWEIGEPLVVSMRLADLERVAGIGGPS